MPPKTLGSIDSLPATSSIVVIGLGAAAYSCVSHLIELGFNNIKIVSKDFNYGGKCVNYGCMPSEYSFLLKDTSKELRLNKLQSFITDLRESVEKQFNSLKIEFVNDEVVSISGKFILLKSGNSICFDHLIFANGNVYKNPERVPLNTGKVISIEKLWQLPIESNLIIYAKNNPAALSIANSAQALGLNVTIILEGKNPLAKLPSWRYFSRQSVKSGINLIDKDARLIRVDQDGVSYEVGAKIETLKYDFILIASKSELNFLKVDGESPSFLDLDLTTSRLIKRSDISYAGDSAGFYTAAEAEEHARLVARNIWSGEQVQLSSLSSIPMSFHGTPPLAMAGAPWTWSVPSDNWIEIDFRKLGWSKIYPEEGRLWYLLSRDGCNVDAIHICHALSAELIATAAVLIRHPLSDPIWRNLSTHPSASEIFKLVN